MDHVEVTVNDYIRIANKFSCTEDVQLYRKSGSSLSIQPIGALKESAHSYSKDVQSSIRSRLSFSLMLFLHDDCQ